MADLKVKSAVSKGRPKTASREDGYNRRVTRTRFCSGARFNVGYGTGEARTFDHGDPFRFFIAQEDIPPQLVATDMVVRISQGPWPSAALAGPGRYDSLKFIDNAETRQSVYQNWDDDVFQVPA